MFKVYAASYNFFLVKINGISATRLLVKFKYQLNICKVVKESRSFKSI